VQPVRRNSAGLSHSECRGGARGSLGYMPGIELERERARDLIMPEGTKSWKEAWVVLAGGLSVEHVALDSVVAEFGWSLKKACGFRALAALSAESNLVAVLFSPHQLSLPWEQALKEVLEAAPSALPILCHGFRDLIHWPQAARAGAFHSLLVPFNVREVRQSLGFVYEAKRRSAVIPMPRQARRRPVVHDHAEQVIA
jgi:hypothetical protein